MSSHIDTARRRMDALRQHRADLKGQIAQLTGEDVYSERAKAEITASLRKRVEQAAKSTASLLWSDLGQGEIATQKELSRAWQQSEASWDYQKLAYLKQSIVDRLGIKNERLGTKDGGGPFGASQAEKIEELRRQYASVGDRHALRALREATSSILAGIPPGESTEGLTASKLRSAFAEDERSERPPELDTLTAELHDLATLKRQARAEILNAEWEITGQGASPASLFGEGGSVWKSEVLGEGRPETTEQRAAATMAAVGIGSGKSPFERGT